MMKDFFILEIFTMGKRGVDGERHCGAKRECTVLKNGIVKQNSASLKDVLRVIEYLNNEICCESRSLVTYEDGPI